MSENRRPFGRSAFAYLIALAALAPTAGCVGSGVEDENEGDVNFEETEQEIMALNKIHLLGNPSLCWSRTSPLKAVICDDFSVGSYVLDDPITYPYDPNAYYRFSTSTNVTSGCLSLNGGQPILTSCSADQAQRWALTCNSAGTGCTVKNRLYNVCLQHLGNSSIGTGFCDINNTSQLFYSAN